VQESLGERIRTEAESTSRRANEVEKHVGEVQSEVGSLRNALREVKGVAEGAQKKAESTEAHLEAEVSAMRTAPVVPSPAPSTATPPAQTSTASSAGAPSPSGWNSAIVPDFPKLFEDFKRSKFTLLWRGSRDGFGSGDFHRRCNGHPNTLTVILDTKGNIFGGFTPVEWESGDWHLNADPSLKSFLFTLKNPHNVPTRRFVLKAKKEGEAIGCSSTCGPVFYDIGVYDNCNATTRSWTFNFGESYTFRFGEKYTNNTGLDGKTFFTGSQHFQVKELEVFEIT
jgi:hypothetical protein